jgi:hypothetical protein
VWEKAGAPRRRPGCQPPGAVPSDVLGEQAAMIMTAFLLRFALSFLVILFRVHYTSRKIVACMILRWYFTCFTLVDLRACNDVVVTSRDTPTSHEDAEMRRAPKRARNSSSFNH